MATDLLVVILAVIFAVQCQQERGRCVDYVQEIGAFRLDPVEPVKFFEALALCDAQQATLLTTINTLNEEERAICGNQWVPIEFYVYFPFYTVNYKTYAANLMTGETIMVDNNFKFSCVPCRHAPLRFPIAMDNPAGDWWPNELFLIHVTQVVKSKRGNLTDEGRKWIRQEVCEFLKAMDCGFILDPPPPNEWTDDNHLVHIVYKIFTFLSTSIPIGVEMSFMDGLFSLRVEDAAFCPEGTTVDKDGVVTHWSEIHNCYSCSQLFQFVANVTTGSILRRDCHVDPDTYRGEWNPQLTRWALAWRDCSPDEQYVNEGYYIQFLNKSDIESRHAQTLYKFTTTEVDADSLQKVAHLADLELRTSRNLSDRIIRELADITGKLNLTSASDFVVAAEPRVSLVVAKLQDSNSVEGFTLHYNPLRDRDIITGNREPTVQGQGLLAMDISPRLLEAHTRVAFVVSWKDIEWFRYSLIGRRFPPQQYLEVIVMLPIRGEVSTWSFASYANHHLDITYQLSHLYENFMSENFGMRFSCVAWNNDLHDWSGCATIYANQSGYSACRCSGKYFVMRDGVPIARYALRKEMFGGKKTQLNNLFTDFFLDKPGLIVATAIECLLSALGLGSIIATAIFFKQWRENTGHKILLQMLLALACNLVLGFVASFKRMTTDGIGCLIYGVLRHYSFLAMFLWMLVLSCLQLKRLTTIAGAKATSHLILKVSMFAWGLPLVPIIFLLSYNYGFYQTDRFDRGYCYPAGIVFQATVQGPAGLILFINFGIFIRIVTKIFQCCDKNKITRHSKNQRAEQLNKLKTSLFMFVLFGFSWVFHILSEERLVLNDFLFDYLFLLTTSTHIFALSLFFILFQDSTRNNWLKLRRKSAIYGREGQRKAFIN